MKASNAYICTTKEIPSEAEIASHQIMLKAGLIRKVASGIYTWMPLGLKILRKIEKVVREEMLKVGALEISMPSVQPRELWDESGRWEQYGSELLRFKDRNAREFCLGPTHEEVVLDLVKKDLKSYKQLPLSLFQIQTKFRDEIRPRFGVMRSREFIMKDAYSFHPDFDSLVKTYNDMYNAYCQIFTRLGLNFRPVNADTGSIGGTGSHEFQVLADSGEDIIAYSDESDYAANIELAESLKPSGDKQYLGKAMEKIATPTQKTCEEVAKLLGCDLSQTVKSLVFEGVDGEPVLLLIRGDHQLNEVKAGKLKQLKSPLTFAKEEVILKHFNCSGGSIGPVGFNGLVIADYDVTQMPEFICGANSDGYHLANVNFARDCKTPDVVTSLRNVVEGDLSPDGRGRLKLCRGIEVGHVFQLRTKYSSAMKLNYLDQNGKSQLVEMGCYGIGVTRILGACIEQNHDDKGAVFPMAMAPFEVVITPVNYHKSADVAKVTDELYQNLQAQGIDVLLDDRNERLGSMLADSELLGIPYRILVSDKTLENHGVEFYSRKNKQTEQISLDKIILNVSDLIKNAKK